MPKRLYSRKGRIGSINESQVKVSRDTNLFVIICYKKLFTPHIVNNNKTNQEPNETSLIKYHVKPHVDIYINGEFLIWD